MTIAAGTGNRCAPPKTRGADFYQTDPTIVRALAATVHLPALLWEPCAGLGAISNTLISLGHGVIAQDLHDYGGDDHIRTGADFLARWSGIDERTIVSNPPYNLAQEFIEQGIRVAPDSYWLLRSQFLHRASSRKVMESLTGYYPLAPRIPRMHKEGWTGKKSAPTDNFAWYRFSRVVTHPLDMRIIRWRDIDEQWKACTD